MKLHVISYSQISIPKDRQRKEFKPEAIVDLANSISTVGLIHPVVVRREGTGYALVAGERRLKALQYVWNFGTHFRCGLDIFREGEVPCLFVGEIDDDLAFEIELEENIKREELPWQNRAAATARLLEFRSRKAAERGEPPPTLATIASETRGDDGRAYTETLNDIIVSKHLDDPDVQKAKSSSDARKILQRKEDLRKSADLGRAVGLTFTSAVHQLFKGDCLEIMANLPESCVDVILTDPPYGIDADRYSDSGGRTPGAHFYDDSFATWTSLLQGFAAAAWRVSKSRAHAYLFCDVDNFLYLKSYMSAAGWRCFRTPLIWVNPQGMRAPWPEMGPQRKYQLCLYAVKGDRPVTRLYSDVLTYPSDDNLGHPAQKPVALYQDLLKRSVRPGDVVLDAFAGSGTIFPACHEFKCKAIGIELDDAAYGLSVTRLGALK